ncbi:ribosomal protein L20 [Onion yellows phytoplasma OY-M]|uniref:Large ribosomal subunit protein bL20 n=1 Tax=Onion yellows phytoplasma (strain OY-M) TaxID=262768 RepID=RL20_ONYPE|nr:RecName: Full=Large ribosomal subunit protein bL20; AltName: Full=50S ribosomal protein L20 [Onion yellows phytoplasma OY-M]BAD04827.1 ribosomal protein L20 [Onion yellows phytoplasma OY-M]
MAKISFTPARHRRRKKVLKMAKGYFGSKSTLYKTAHEQVMRSLQYAYRDRKQRKRDFRKLWISRINAGAMLCGMQYSYLMHGLALAKVDVNRKVLADLAHLQPGPVESVKAVEVLQQETQPQPEEKTSLQPEKVLSTELSEEKSDDTLETKPQTTQVKAKKPSLDLSKMLLHELKKLAKEHKVPNFHKLKKAEIVTALKKALAKKII